MNKENERFRNKFKEFLNKHVTNEERKDIILNELNKGLKLVQRECKYLKYEIEYKEIKNETLYGVLKLYTNENPIVVRNNFDIWLGHADNIRMMRWIVNDIYSRSAYEYNMRTMKLNKEMNNEKN